MDPWEVRGVKARKKKAGLKNDGQETQKKEKETRKSKTVVRRVNEQ